MDSIKKVYLIIWISAGIFLSYMSIDMLRVSPQSNGLPKNFNEKINKTTKRAHPNCTIAVHFGQEDIASLIVLGYSLNNIEESPPKAFAFYDDNENLTEYEEQEISKYFTIYRYPEVQRNPEIFNYSSPIINISVNGVFSRSPWEACDAKTPAAVPLRDNILIFNSKFVVYKDIKEYFAGENSLYIRSDSMNTLPPYYAIEDAATDKVNFWFSYQFPMYVYYSRTTFKSLIRKKNTITKGSLIIYRLLLNVFNKALDTFNYTVS